MTSFKINNDDLAVRSIQSTKKASITASSPVTPVKASNPVQTSPENLPLKTAAVDKKTNDASGTPRQHEDRRKNDEAVLLDTRSLQDRRNNKDNKEIDTSKSTTTSRSIDEIV